MSVITKGQKAQVINVIGMGRVVTQIHEVNVIDATAADGTFPIMTIPANVVITEMVVLQLTQGIKVDSSIVLANWGQSIGVLGKTAALAVTTNPPTAAKDLMIAPDLDYRMMTLQSYVNKNASMDNNNTTDKRFKFDPLSQKFSGFEVWLKTAGALLKDFQMTFRVTYVEG